MFQKLFKSLFESPVLALIQVICTKTNNHHHKCSHPHAQIHFLVEYLGGVVSEADLLDLEPQRLVVPHCRLDVQVVTYVFELRGLLVLVEVGVVFVVRCRVVARLVFDVDFRS